MKGWFGGSSSPPLKTLRRGEENIEDYALTGEDEGMFSLYLIGLVVMDSKQQYWWKACVSQKIRSLHPSSETQQPMQAVSLHCLSGV